MALRRPAGPAGQRFEQRVKKVVPRLLLGAYASPRPLKGLWAVQFGGNDSLVSGGWETNGADLSAYAAIALARRVRVGDDSERAAGAARDIQPAPLYRTARLQAVGILPSRSMAGGNPEHADILAVRRPDRDTECQVSVDVFPPREHLRPAPLLRAIHEAFRSRRSRWPRTEQ